MKRSNSCFFNVFIILCFTCLFPLSASAEALIDSVTLTKEHRFIRMKAVDVECQGGRIEISNSGKDPLSFHVHLDKYCPFYSTVMKGTVPGKTIKVVPFKEIIWSYRVILYSNTPKHSDSMVKRIFGSRYGKGSTGMAALYTT